MEVILLQKIDKLGNLGDKVTVKPGYARNYLIPQGKATAATAESIARFEARRLDLELAAAAALADAKSRAEQLGGAIFTLPAKAGAEGRLFGSVGPADIAEAVSDAGIALHRREIRMPKGPIRAIGEYLVDVHLHSDVNVQIRVHVVAE